MKRSSVGNRQLPTGVVGLAMPRSLRPSVLLLLGLTATLPQAAPARGGNEPATATLPEVRTFLREVRARLHSDDFLLDQYTFTERQTQRQLDSGGNVKKVTSALYEVYPSPEPGHTYRKLIERDGTALTAEELAKEDQKQEAKEARKVAKLYSADASRRASAESERRLKETKTIDEIFQVFEFRIVGREALGGRSAIVLAFAPRPGLEPDTRGGRILQKFVGRAWVDEEDRQLVRVEAELMDDLSFGFGLLAKLKKGARAEILRRKVNDEIWLPALARFVGHGRLLLVKGLHIDSLSEYSDYKKFTVATDSEVKPNQHRP